MASPSTHNILSPLLMGALARAVDRLSCLSDDEVGVNFPSDAVTTCESFLDPVFSSNAIACSYTYFLHRRCSSNARHFITSLSALWTFKCKVSLSCFLPYFSFSSTPMEPCFPGGKVSRRPSASRITDCRVTGLQFRCSYDELEEYH